LAEFPVESEFWAFAVPALADTSLDAARPVIHCRRLIQHHALHDLRLFVERQVRVRDIQILSVFRLPDGLDLIDRLVDLP